MLTTEHHLFYFSLPVLCTHWNIDDTAHRTNRCGYICSWIGRYDCIATLFCSKCQHPWISNAPQSVNKHKNINVHNILFIAKSITKGFDKLINIFNTRSVRCETVPINNGSRENRKHKSLYLYVNVVSCMGMIFLCSTCGKVLTG